MLSVPPIRLPFVVAVVIPLEGADIVLSTTGDTVDLIIGVDTLTLPMTGGLPMMEEYG